MGEFAPFLLALLAAFLFAVGDHMQNIGLASVDSRTGTAASICATAAMCWLVAPVLTEWSNWLHPAALIFALVGVFRPALSANLSVMGIRFLGPTLSSTLASTSPLFGTALGILWLGESLTWQTALGTAGIVGAVILLAQRRGASVAAAFPLWALALPVGSAFIRSCAHVLTRYGLLLLPDPFFATLVAFTVSAVVATGARMARPSERAFDWRAPGLRYFAAAGAAFGIAVTALNEALLEGTVVMVAPIIAAAPVFTLLLSVIFFRREVLTARIGVAVLVVFASVVLIGLSR